MPELGEWGQKKLLQANVLVVGAGGLGCPVLQYLTAAGVGTIGIVDDDVVALSNLHRQVLYDMSDIGLSKVKQATQKLHKLNLDVQLRPYDIRLTAQNALNIIEAYDIVVDGTDNFESRYMVNDACVLLGKPLVYGAISRFEGQVAVFNCKDENGNPTANYRDLFPDPPAPHEVQNCVEAGVLGVLPALIGSLQATEVIKWIAGIGEPLVNRLLTYNVLTNQLFEIAISPSQIIPGAPKDKAAFLKMDYSRTCTLPAVVEIEAEDFERLLHDKTVTIIDVREKDEPPRITGFPHLHIPSLQLPEAIPTIHGDTIITFCQTGVRSRQTAAALLHTFGTAKKIYSLKGGIAGLKKYINEENYAC